MRIREQEEDEHGVERINKRTTPNSVDNRFTPNHHHHPPTPLPKTDKISKSNHKKRSESVWSHEVEDGSVSCTKCRAHPREKITVVPLDNNGHNKHSSPLLRERGGWVRREGRVGF